MDAAGLRPLRIGEVLDVGIKIYRRRFATLVRAVAVIVAPVSVVTVVVRLSAGLDSSRVDRSGRDVAAIVGANLVIGIVGLVSSELAVAATFDIVSGDYLDRSPTWRESVRTGWSRLRSVIWVAVLHLVLASLGLVGCFVPGIYLWTSWSVAQPSLLLENRRGMAALRRSRELVKGRWWPTFAAILLTMLLTSIVQGALQGLRLGVVSRGNEVVVAATSGVISAASSILVMPLTVAVITVIYFDLRVRKEGFDLELLARGIGVDPPPTLSTVFASEEPEQPPYWPPPPGWRAGPPAGG